MFAKSRKDKFIEQAQEIANDIGDALTPHLERARDELGPRLADARDTIAPHVENAVDNAKEQFGPRLSDARDQIAPRVADARDTIQPYVDDARKRFVKDVVPAVQQAVSDARDNAGPVVEEAQRRGTLAVAALKGEPVKKSHKGRNFLLLAGALGLGGVVFSKLRGGDDTGAWQSSYTPTPTSPSPVPSSPAAPMGGAHAAPGDDLGAAAPGEAISDEVETPHGVSTPDAPLSVADDVEKPTEG